MLILTPRPAEGSKKCSVSSTAVYSARYSGNRPREALAKYGEGWIAITARMERGNGDLIDAPSNHFLIPTRNCSGHAPTKRLRACAEDQDFAAMIPCKIHFCYGFQGPEAPFYYAHYLAVKSAGQVNRPEEISISIAHEPKGEWWNETRKIANVITVDPPAEIFGRPLRHFAHQADVFRLRKLLSEGGIYLDIDTLCLKPFHDLLHHKMVMARQSAKYGLCNAVMLAEPQSRFLNAWLHRYRTFRAEGRDHYWDEHSVRVPRRLSRRFWLWRHITILPHYTFFPVAWNDPQGIFVRDDITPFERSYCVHLWETDSLDFLRDLTPEKIARGSSAYCRLARQFA